MNMERHNSGAPAYSSDQSNDSLATSSTACPNQQTDLEGPPEASQPSTVNMLPPYSESNGHACPSWPSGSSVTQPTTSSPTESFFDIAPRSDSTSFQVGYLGLRGFEAWIKGEVLVKLDSETKRKGGYTRCTVQLQARESIRRKQSASAPTDNDSEGTASTEAVELFSHSLTLWDISDVTAPSSSATPSLPSSLPFSFPLTPDLPHCIHLRDSSLTYQIVAKLFSANSDTLPDATKTIPVHLVRYTRPGPLNETELSEIDGAELHRKEFSLQPHTWVQQLPTLVYAQINRTIFRRAEPIEIRVRIPPPDSESLTEKGLRLRAVEADLVRLISVKRPRSSESAGEGASANQHHSSTEVVDVHEALLAHSGKLCRFHSQKSVLLRLSLHPPFDRANMPHPHPDHDALASGPVFGRGGGGGCESITQETLMHQVSFEVRIKVGIQGGRGERRDIICKRKVKILPGAAGALEETATDTNTGFSNEKEKLKQAEKARVTTTDFEASSSSYVPADDVDPLDFDAEEEYDGYEDIGRSLDELLHETDGIDAPTSSSSHEERLEQLRQLLEQSDPTAADGPPPTLLESQNDLQVEVEVEGVGLAMPRNRHPADTFPTMGHGEDAYMQPPPIDDETADSTMPYSVINADGPSGSVPNYRRSSQDPLDDPPPPISPLASKDIESQRESHPPARFSPQMPGAFNLDSDMSSAIPSHSAAGLARSPPRLASYPNISARAEPRPSYETAVASRGHDHAGHTTVTENPSSSSRRSGQVEPPPYIAGSREALDEHEESIPTFDQAIRQPRSSRQHGTSSNRYDSAAIPSLPPLEVGEVGVNAINHDSAYARPPAYGTSPHPPSYDA